MLKTISAALLAVSVLAAPALAAGQATNQANKTAPVIKSEQVKQVKPNVLNANARMGHHHARYASHHRSSQAYRRAEDRTNSPRFRPSTSRPPPSAAKI